MSVDPTDPDTFEDDADQDDPDRGIEVPEADAVEQLAERDADRDDPGPGRVPDDADEADVIEQSRTVPNLGDEEDYQ